LIQTSVTSLGVTIAARKMPGANVEGIGNFTDLGRTSSGATATGTLASADAAGGASGTRVTRTDWQPARSSPKRRTASPGRTGSETQNAVGAESAARAQRKKTTTPSTPFMIRLVGARAGA
jgi:hypothetical protein